MEGKALSGPFSFERLATSPPQADHVLVDLFFIRGGWGEAVLKLPNTYMIRQAKKIIGVEILGRGK